MYIILKIKTSLVSYTMIFALHISPFSCLVIRTQCAFPVCVCVCACVRACVCICVRVFIHVFVTEGLMKTRHSNTSIIWYIKRQTGHSSSCQTIANVLTRIFIEYPNNDKLAQHKYIVELEEVFVKHPTKYRCHQIYSPILFPVLACPITNDAQFYQKIFKIFNIIW